jgi:SNF2 family DNA or RNA helicase
MNNDIGGFATFDNINNKLIDDLKVQLREGCRLQIAAASFSIYAFEALKEELEQVKELQFIFTSPTFNSSETGKKEKREFFIPKLNRERNLYGSDYEIRLRNQLSQKAIARECADWIRRKVHFKSIVTEGRINGFMNLDNKEIDYTYLPFNEFTTTELGCDRGDNISPGINRFPSPATEHYINSFKELWDDRQRFKDVTETILENIETVYKENSPEFIYYVTLYNIFNEFLEDLSEDELPKEGTGFRTSQIWNKLYDFQRDAALAIINKLSKYNGCILADSVGLGKTFTALAVIKYYECLNRNVLVLCPKKLHDNWDTFTKNYVNNPISKDRLRYDILFHSDLSRESGYSSGTDLSRVNWGNYDLVVIDESHNFRNGGKVTQDDEDDDPKENRYLKLMNKVIKDGIPTKVLMLSATPVNNRFNDLKNQLQLAYEGESEIMNERLEIGTDIDDIFRQAQKAYNKWSRLEPDERTTERLLDSLSFDFFQLLDAVTIARSRKHIEKYYDISEIGKFPSRLPPIERRSPLTDLTEAPTFSEIANKLNWLNYSVYTPSNYIQASKLHLYQSDNGDDGTGLSMAGREKGIRKLMAINMLKRLESSVNSFRLTVKRVKNQVDDTIDKIDKHDGNLGVIEAYDLDITDEEDDLFVGGKKTRINLEDMDTLSWRRDLEEDQEILGSLIDMVEPITPAHDTKLKMLEEDLRDKFDNPINGQNQKVLIFTAFSDTADYLYENLALRIKNNTGLNVALITGDNQDKWTINNRKLRSDYNTILTLFSPMSKERDKIYPNLTDEIDVLIATDCISEGQNLQDCDYLINFDIHWNPVRIIQRFGRIDRIGSKNDVIQLVNYWPDMELDDYINLKGRVESRMKATILTATGDDNPLTQEETNDLEYRRLQLERLKKEVVDLEEMNTGVNIMDLGLNDFRMDLLPHKDDIDLIRAPFGMSAVVAANDIVKPGVMYILKNRNNGVNINKLNLLHPFYMVYLGYDGETICTHLQPKQLLDRMRAVCKGKDEYDRELCKAFNEETDDGKQMQRYSSLLQDAIRSIIEVKEERDVLSLFSAGETTALTNNVQGLDDFELICFLVIR